MSAAAATTAGGSGRNATQAPPLQQCPWCCEDRELAAMPGCGCRPGCADCLVRHFSCDAPQLVCPVDECRQPVTLAQVRSLGVSTEPHERLEVVSCAHDSLGQCTRPAVSTRDCRAPSPCPRCCRSTLPWRPPAPAASASTAPPAAPCTCWSPTPPRAARCSACGAQARRSCSFPGTPLVQEGTLRQCPGCGVPTLREVSRWHVPGWKLEGRPQRRRFAACRTTTRHCTAPPLCSGALQGGCKAVQCQNPECGMGWCWECKAPRVSEAADTTTVRSARLDLGGVLLQLLAARVN